jgi:glycosyltransferase involved in cell wall biosynthesis
MRIVYFVHAWPPDRVPNGVASAVAAIAPAIRSAGHSAEIVSLIGRPDDGEDSGATFVESAASPKSALRRLRDRILPRFGVFESAPHAIAASIRATPKLFQADIVEMEESFGWSRIIARKIRQPIVTRLHGPYFLTGASAHEGPFSRFENERVRREGLAIAEAAAVSAPSRYALDAVRERYRLALENAVVIPNTVRVPSEAEAWRPDAADPDEILFVGRFDRIKGADIALKAFALLARDRPRLRLTFVGPDSGAVSFDGRILDRDGALARLMPPESARRVKFLGVAPASELAPLRRRAFVTIISSRTEMFANVMLEALAAASPVVAARVGGIPDIAADGREALLVEPESPERLAEAIGALLDRPERAIELGRAGRRRVAAEFAPARVAAASLAFYEHVCARVRRDARER